MSTYDNFDIVSQRLGFGCGRLKGGIEKTKSLRLVHTALDLGIRHFDVAPLYGLGAAEPVLGQALKGRPETVVVFTKVGLPRPAAPGLMQTARAIVKPLAQRIPSLRNAVLKGMAQRATPANFDPNFIAQSLESSMRLLQRDRLDALLLHEATPSAQLEPLEHLLERYVSQGRLGCYGSSTGEPLNRLVSFGRIRQYRCPDVGSAQMAASDETDILHGAFRFIAPAITDAMVKDKLLQDILAGLLPAGVEPGQAAGGLSLAYVLAQSRGRLLFSTDQPQRLVSTIHQIRHITASAQWIPTMSALHFALTDKVSP